MSFKQKGEETGRTEDKGMNRELTSHPETAVAEEKRNGRKGSSQGSGESVCGDMKQESGS